MAILRLNYFINPNASEITGKYVDDKICLTSFAEVLLGSFDYLGQSVEPGDIVRLADSHTRSVMNPKFQAMKENRSNASFDDAAQEIPVQTTHMFFSYYGEEIFKIDPAGPDVIEDSLTILVHKDDIKTVIKKESRAYFADAFAEALKALEYEKESSKEEASSAHKVSDN